MSFMNKIKSLFAPAGSGSSSGSRTCVVDGARLVDEKTGRRLAPREQIQMLNALARVAKQEALDLHVVFESDRALREVEDGGEYSGVRVHFAPDTEQLVAKALNLCRNGGSIISSGVTMESRATEAGITVIGSGTFRKVFLPAGLPGGGGDRGNGDRGGRDRRRDRRRPDRDNRGGGRGQPRNQSTAEPANDAGNTPPETDGGDSAVRNLIDLVE